MDDERALNAAFLGHAIARLVVVVDRPYGGGRGGASAARAPLLMAEGVYAGGMLGLTVGLAGAAVAIVVVGGVIYYVNYSSGR